MADVRYFLGCDPGLINFAGTLVAFKGNEYRVLRNVMIVKTITDLKQNLEKSRDKFLKEIAKVGIYKEKKRVLSRLVIERFQARGFAGGASISEAVSLMLGVLLTAGVASHFHTVTAASWKNAVNRVFDLKEFYKKAWAKPLRIEPHRIDSVLMCLYSEDLHNKTSHIKGLKTKKSRMQLLRMIQDASL